MPKLNESVQQLQGTIGQLSVTAQELSLEQLDAALTDAHNVLVAAQEVAESARIDDLKRFLLEVASLLDQLKNCAPAQTPAQLENLIQPETLLERLTSSYSTYIAPMIVQAQDITQTSASATDDLNRWGAIASLGIQVFNTCAEILKHHKDMQPHERVFAMAGTVLMVAGVGLLVAATFNPQIGIPAVAALTIVTLGCYLSQKALARIKKKTAFVELYKVSEQIDNTAGVYQVGNYPRRLLSFGPTTTAKSDTTIDEDNSLRAKIMRKVRSLLNRDKH